MPSLHGIDMNGVTPEGEYEALPEGLYIAKINVAERKGTKDKFDKDNNPDPNNGKNFYLEVPLEITEGEYEGFVERARLNLWNANPTAVRIAKSELLAIQTAINDFGEDTDNWIGKHIGLRIKLDRNAKLKRYYEAVPAGMQIPAPRPVAAPASAAPVHAAAPAAAKPAWAK